MSELVAIVQRHLDSYGVTEAAFAKRMGINPQTINAWRNRGGLKRLPERRILEAVARETRTPYEEVLHAALVDTGYAAGVTPAIADEHPSEASEPAASPPAEVHQPRPEDSVGVASRQGHAPSRSRVSGGRGTRPPHS